MDEVCQNPSTQSSKSAKASTHDLDLIFEILLGQFFPFRGFILFDAAGHLLRSTTKADEFCTLLHKGAKSQAFGVIDRQSVATTIPEQITTLCQYLSESCDEFPDYTLQLYDTAFLPGGIRFYLNVEWIDLTDQPTKCMLVTIEDLTQIAQHRATADAYRYDLTERETEVWTLYLQGLSYREVSDELIIALNTVKKHMKNIFRKCNIECRCRHLV
ncbi:helix-turn-helix transcriptional regulator [Leptolyngbya sp. Heron Island J]|uniref:helix-turn-helix transcriptional regulator n=1 Tax=Leptolyngbya sp. Heron Island J TaxID=1385935 RepID=UPI0013788AEA|nr:helix-turn-helix transcriptional regulator [Leptolyngbya sp. Heron Island J]